MHTTATPYVDRATPTLVYMHRHTELLSATGRLRYPVLCVDADCQLLECLQVYTDRVHSVTAADLPDLEFNTDTCLISASIDYCPAEHQLRHTNLLQLCGRLLGRITARHHGTRHTCVHVTTACANLVAPNQPLWPALDRWSRTWGTALAAAVGRVSYDHERHYPGPSLSRHMDLVTEWDYGALCLWQHPHYGKCVDLRLLIQT
jgi:hypothetical protein